MVTLSCHTEICAPSAILIVSGISAPIPCILNFMPRRWFFQACTLLSDPTDWGTERDLFLSGCHASGPVGCVPLPDIHNVRNVVVLFSKLLHKKMKKRIKRENKANEKPYKMYISDFYFLSFVQENSCHKMCFQSCNQTQMGLTKMFLFWLK